MEIKTFTEKFEYGGKEVILETGYIARQATASVTVRCGDTVVLVTVVVDPKSEDKGFLPLSVFYKEEFAAAGIIPGGFLRREGRPTDKESLTARLIDRPLRPLFPKTFSHETQVCAAVKSYDHAFGNTDVLAMIGASAVCALSGAPFEGPIGAARVGYINNEFRINPSEEELLESNLDLVVAGTKDAVLMVESDAKQLTEEQMLEAVWYGHEQYQNVIAAINRLVDAAGNASMGWVAPVENTEVKDKVEAVARAKVTEVYKIQDKQERGARLSELAASVVAGLAPEGDDAALSAKDVEKEFHALAKRVVRERILAGEPRIDGRDKVTVRPLKIEAGYLPRTHGSAVFTRGETQAIVTATLGNDKDSQLIDAMAGESRDDFMLHYNFPPYCVGETGMMGGPKRREIGHGNLAKRAIKGVMPKKEAFPYVIRIVSDITESNGSSSMASVCGASLSLMDAGVPIAAPVAGIAMGLVKSDSNYVVLTDILGDEDHLGDMDFKVAGTSDGVTALQMDIKITGITREIMQVALSQAKEARSHILGKMQTVIDKPRDEISPFAPRIITLMIAQDKIRDVIGKGGETIRAITEKFGVDVNIEQNGEVSVFAVDQAQGQAAIDHIKQLVAEPEIGEVYEGKVVKILEFGAIVEFLGSSGMVHISQLVKERVGSVDEVVKEGQIVKVKVLEIDKARGRVSLSMKECEQPE